MPIFKVRNSTNDDWIVIGWGEDPTATALGVTAASLVDLRDEEYVVVSASASGVPTAERVLTAGSGITLVDGGASGALTINTAVGETLLTDLPFILLSPVAIPGLNFERYLAAAAGLTLVDGGFGGPLTITPAWGTPASPSVNLAASAIGTAASFAHSDHTHQLDQAIVPTWTGLHTFQAAGAAVTKVIVKGVAGQSANLLELQDSTAAVVLQADVAGRIGFGGTAINANYYLHFDQALAPVASTGIAYLKLDSSTNQNIRGMSVYSYVSAAAGVTADVYGLGGFARNTGAGDITALEGAYIVSRNAGAGDVTTLYGVWMDAQNTGAGNVATSKGFLSRSINTGAAGITTMIGVEASFANLNAVAVTTSAYGFRVDTLYNTGTITNTYGVYVGDITAGTQTNTPFSFYASDAGTYNYFAGRVGVNQVAPGGMLQIDASGAAVIGAIIKGAAAQSANLQEWQDSAAVVLAYVEPDGEIAILGDSKALKLGAASDMSVFYDGTDGYVKTDVVAPSDLKITTGAAKTLELQTSVTEDLFMPLAGAKVPAVNAPSWVAFSTNLGSYTFAIDDYADLAATEVLHGYEEGTDLDVHVHFITDGANDATARKVKYQVFFSWGDINEVMSGEASVTGEADIAAAEADRMHHYLALGTLTGTNYLMSSLLKTRIKRIAGTGVEPANDPFVEMVGIHYKLNTLGSRQELVK